MPGRDSSKNKFKSLPLTESQTIWFIIAIIVVADLAWDRLSNIHLSVSPSALAPPSLFIGIGIVYSTVRIDQRISAIALAISQLLTFTMAIITLSYLIATANFPLIDHQLAAIDAAMGFDWISMFRWTREHPLSNLILRLCYPSNVPQVFVFLILFGAIGRMDRVRELVWLYVLTLLVIVPMSLIMPAAGAWDYYGVSHLTNAYYLADLHALRDGTLSNITVPYVTGIIQFPSFHAALGLIMIFVARGIWFLFLPSLMLNLIVIVSAITEGGHHLIDIMAGLAVVPPAVVILQMFRR